MTNQEARRRFEFETGTPSTTQKNTENRSAMSDVKNSFFVKALRIDRAAGSPKHSKALSIPRLTDQLSPKNNISNVRRVRWRIELSCSQRSMNCARRSVNRMNLIRQKQLGIFFIGAGNNRLA